MKQFLKVSALALYFSLSAGIIFAAEVETPGANTKNVAPAAAKETKTGSDKSAAPPKGYSKPAAAKAALAAKLVDINTASISEIADIPGIGKEYASKIIAGRPYANKRQLKSRNILPANVYRQIKDLIIAKKLS
ncbi:MAG: helix-hairpin-helix domain-containing protein [Desulfuromonadaceae bacterium]|nr:helix-hairpin-helix domain-containing protein [Desulfuromonadaceae bacterium]